MKFPCINLSCHEISCNFSLHPILTNSSLGIHLFYGSRFGIEIVSIMGKIITNMYVTQERKGGAKSIF